MQKTKLMALVAIKCFVLGIFLTAFACVNYINAQTSGNAKKFGSDQKWGILGDVSLYDGSLNFNLPLMTVEGRGAVSYTPTLKIRGEWGVETEADDYGEPPIEYYHSAIYKGTNTSPDFNNYFSLPIGYGPGVLVFKRQSANSSYSWGTSLTRIYYYGAGGGVTELRDALYQGERKSRSINTGLSRGSHFISYDGSAMTFISDTDVRDFPYCPNPGSCTYPAPYPNGILKFSDGTEYRINNGVIASIRDRNGNTMSFTYYPTNSYVFGVQIPGQIKDATDSNGRIIQFEYGVQDTQPYGLCDRITYKGFGGASRIIRISHKQLSSVLRSGETIPPIEELFPGAYNVLYYPGTVIASVWLPDGNSFQFKYNRYAELARVETPLGGAVEYDFFAPENGGFVDLGTSAYIYRRLSERRIYREGNVQEKKETYNLQNTECTSECWNLWNRRTVTTLEVFDVPANTKLLAEKHYFYGSAEGSMAASDAGDYSFWRVGKEYKTEILDANGSVLKRVENDWQQRAAVPWWGGGNPDASPAVDPRVVEVRSIDIPSNLVYKKRYLYDEFNNQIDVFEHDFGLGQAGALLKHTHTDYLRGAYISNFYPSDPHIRRLPERQWISADEQGSVKLSLTEFEYDNYNSDTNHSPLVSRANVVGHNSTSFGTNNLLRGNVTKATAYENAQNQTGAVSTYSQYDILGNLVKAIDAKGFASTLDYTDNFGSPDGEARANSAPAQLNGQNSFAFATTGTNVMGWNIGYSQFDYFTGSIVNAEDINNVVTKTLYDFADRNIQTFYAVGTIYENQTTIIYDDANRRIETKKDLFSLNDNLNKKESFYDGLGRTVETRDYELSGYTAIKTTFDALGRAKQKSNSYRPLAGEQPVWTEYYYNFLGQPVKTRTADNAEVITEFVGNSITVTDQSGRKRRSVSNALEQVIRIDEPNAQGELGTIENPVQPTYYLHTPTGKLAKVTQGAQSRYFLYDSLGRLIRIRQPEQAANLALTLSDPITGNSQWSTAATYDARGDAITSTDARGVTITNTYDNLRRLLTKSYNDNLTPTISYTYDDTNVPFSKGRLTKIDNGVSVSESISFDAVGRLLSYRQTTDGQSYNTSYSYSLTGALLEQTYPSGRKIRNSFDDNGELESVKGQKSPGGSIQTYASSFVRNSSGAITSMKLGNGLFETAALNSRQQISELALGTTNTNADLWKVNFTYGGTDNNGNIKSQTINTGTTTFVQNYQYDSVNRLVEAKEELGTQQIWKQTFGYDQFGNRTQFSQIVGTESLSLNNLTLPQIDDASNRFMTGQGYEYDSNGNLTKDAQGQSFKFNGDNKITEVKNSANIDIALYFYDGNGKRVKKITADELVIFVYDANSTLIAEYSTKNPVNPKIGYITRDHLGTPRIITDQFRQVISRRDHMPFGETITANRSAGDKYGVADNIRQGFTGYQKDTETGLDYAEARYYNSGHGRFTAVDPLLASGKGPNPQTFNRYVYCLNRPLVAIDPTGLSTIIIEVDEKSKKASILFSFKKKDRSVQMTVYAGIADGRGTSRMNEFGPSPYGVYKISEIQGGYNSWRYKGRYGGPEAWGTGKIQLTAKAGEAVWYNRDGINLHGGSTALAREGKDPYAPYQELRRSDGCVRMYNASVNNLIGQIREAEREGDPVNNVYIGSREFLKRLAMQKDGQGNFLYPDLSAYRDTRATGGLEATVSINLTQDTSGIDGSGIDGDDDGDEDENDEFKYGDEEGDDYVDDEERQLPYDYG